MSSNFIWAGGGTYPSGPTSILTTQLNALASTAMCAAGSAIQNTGGYTHADVEFVAGGTYTPVANGFIALWLLTSIDGGSNYEDGSNTVTPPRPADCVIQVRAGTTITPRAGYRGLIMPLGWFKAIAMNQTGNPLPSTGNIIRYSLYNLSST